MLMMCLLFLSSVEMRVLVVLGVSSLDGDGSWKDRLSAMHRRVLIAPAPFMVPGFMSIAMFLDGLSMWLVRPWQLSNDTCEMASDMGHTCMGTSRHRQPTPLQSPNIFGCTSRRSLSAILSLRDRVFM